jgi:hypothetical protein
MPVVSRLRQTNANAASSEFTSISILESQNDWGLGRGLLGIARRVWIRSTLSESFHQVPHVTKWPQGAYRTRRCSGVLLSLLCAFMFAHPSSVMISTICIDWSRIAKCRGVLCVCTGQVKVLSSQYSKSCNWCHSPPPLSDCFSDPDCLDNLVYIRNGRGISMSLYHYTVFYGNENTMDCLFTAFERHIYWAHCWQEVWIAPAPEQLSQQPPISTTPTTHARPWNIALETQISKKLKGNMHIPTEIYDHVCLRSCHIWLLCLVLNLSHRLSIVFWTYTMSFCIW